MCVVSTLSRDMVFSCLGHGSVSSFHDSSCLMSHHCVLTVCLSGVARCLFCVETLAFLAESRLLAVYLLTCLKRMILWLSLFYGYNVS